MRRNLKNFDVVVFYTTEDLTKPGKVDTPPMGPNGMQDLLDWVKAGGGFMGLSLCERHLPPRPEPIRARVAVSRHARR